MQHRAHRYRTQYPIELRTPQGNQQAIVADISNNGARFERVRNLQRGGKISFYVLGRLVEGTVLWAVGAQAGVTFRPQINDDILDTLRYRRDARQGAHRGTVGFRFTEMR